MEHLFRYSLALALLIFQTNGRAADPLASFSTARAFTTYPQPVGIEATATGVVVADFNNDGLPDIAVSEPGFGIISIILSYGNDSFRLPIIRTGAGPGDGIQTVSLVAADFNRDGFMDVAMSTGDAYPVVIALGNGDGTLRTPVITASHLWPLEVADLNGDGIPDLIGGAVSGQGSASISAINFLIGRGDGTFAAATPLNLGVTSIGPVATRDFNGDGKPDLIFSTRPSASGSYSLYMAAGVGNGTFLSPVLLTVPGDPGQFFTADVNGDGNFDLLVFGSAVSPGLYVLLGNGNGTFQSARFSAVRGGATRFNSSHVALDVNGDGKLDLVLGPNALAILLGNGDGTFAYVRTLPAGSAAVAAADFNGDGMPDLAIGNNSQASVLINYGNANFQQPPAGPRIGGPISSSPFYRQFWVFPADVNGDGKLDVIAAGDSIQVFPGDGQGSFAPPFTLNHAVFPDLRVAAMGDFTGDGRPDVVMVTPGKIEEFSGTAQGTLIAGKTTAIPTILAILDMKAGDFNQDGKLDIAVLYQSPAELVVYPGDGSGGFGAGIISPTPGVPYALDMNDFDGDGKLDAVVVDQLEGFAVYRGTGTGAFEPLNRVHWTNIYGIASGDVNGDHKIDLVMTNWTNQGVLTFLGNGDGTFQPPGGSPSHISGGMNYPRQVVLGDLNGDGNLDVIAANNGSNDFTVLMGRGDGNFNNAQRFICAELYPVALGLGPFFGSPIPDLAVLTTDRGTNVRHVRLVRNGSPR
jgi:hypothetical protein